MTSPLTNANNISVESIAQTAIGNILKVAEQNADDTNLAKAYGVVNGSGLLI